MAQAGCGTVDCHTIGGFEGQKYELTTGFLVCGLAPGTWKAASVRLSRQDFTVDVAIASPFNSGYWQVIKDEKENITTKDYSMIVLILLLNFS